MTMIHRGDVFTAKLNGEGSIQSGIRPVIVISNDMNNKYSTTVQVIPCTTKNKKELPIHVNLTNEEFFARPSMALVEQLVVINKTSLMKRVGQTSTQTLNAIENAILIQLGFARGERKSSPSFFKKIINRKKR